MKKGKKGDKSGKNLVIIIIIIAVLVIASILIYVSMKDESETDNELGLSPGDTQEFFRTGIYETGATCTGQYRYDAKPRYMTSYKCNLLGGGVFPVGDCFLDVPVSEMCDVGSKDSTEGKCVIISLRHLDPDIPDSGPPYRCFEINWKKKCEVIPTPDKYKDRYPLEKLPYCATIR